MKFQANLTTTQDKETIQTILKVLPNQSYTIFVRAYSVSAKSEVFSESPNVTVSSYPEPQALKLNSTTPTSMIIMWNVPENVSNFAIQFTKQDSQDVHNVTNFLIKDEFNNKFFQVDNLEPKTKYNFSMLLVYANSNRTYHWAHVEKIEFETLGDVPSIPGKPKVEHLQDTVYRVIWNASRDNGAPVNEYILESKRVNNLEEFKKEERLETRFKRSVDDSSDVSIDHNEIEEDVTETPKEVDEKPEEKWIERNRKPETNWIITPDLKPIDQFIFRVRAVNSYGISGYSSISDFLNATQDLAKSGTISGNEKSNILLLMISLPISITLLGLFLVCAILSEWNKF